MDKAKIKQRYNELVADGGLNIASINTVKFEFKLTHKEAIDIILENCKDG